MSVSRIGAFALLVSADERVKKAEKTMVDAVIEARRQGWTWQDIGGVFGVSRQAAWERFHEVVDQAIRSVT